MRKIPVAPSSSPLSINPSKKGLVRKMFSFFAYLLNGVWKNAIVPVAKDVPQGLKKLDYETAKSDFFVKKSLRNISLLIFGAVISLISVKVFWDNMGDTELERLQIHEAIDTKVNEKRTEIAELLSFLNPFNWVDGNTNKLSAEQELSQLDDLFKNAIIVFETGGVLTCPAEFFNRFCPEGASSVPVPGVLHYLDKKEIKNDKNITFQFSLKKNIKNDDVLRTVFIEHSKHLFSVLQQIQQKIDGLNKSFSLRSDTLSPMYVSYEAYNQYIMLRYKYEVYSNIYQQFNSFIIALNKSGADMKFSLTVSTPPGPLVESSSPSGSYLNPPSQPTPQQNTQQPPSPSSEQNNSEISQNVVSLITNFLLPNNRGFDISKTEGIKQTIKTHLGENGFTDSVSIIVDAGSIMIKFKQDPEYRIAIFPSGQLSMIDSNGNSYERNKSLPPFLMKDLTKKEFDQAKELIKNLSASTEQTPQQQAPTQQTPAQDSSSLTWVNPMSLPPPLPKIPLSENAKNLINSLPQDKDSYPLHPIFRSLDIEEIQLPIKQYLDKNGITNIKHITPFADDIQIYFTDDDWHHITITLSGNIEMSGLRTSEADRLVTVSMSDITLDEIAKAKQEIKKIKGN